jgi:hypothetical protein
MVTVGLQKGGGGKQIKHNLLLLQILLLCQRWQVCQVFTWLLSELYMLPFLLHYDSY